MGTLLGPSWLDGSETQVIELRDDASVALVREAVRAVAADAGLGTERAESLVTAASEVAHNHLRHGGGGEIAVRRTSRLGTAGVEVLGRDAGPGIADPTAAIMGGGVGGTSGDGRRAGLGVGFAGALRLADEVDVDTRWGEGTTIALRRFAQPVPRSELAILGRPCPGERLMGDDAGWRRDDLSFVAVVADGLGHGPPARAASAALPPLVRENATRPLAELQTVARAALASTRGAVMAIARLEHRSGELSHVGVGNVESLVAAPSGTRHLTSIPGVVGVSGPGDSRARPLVNRVPFPPRSVLVMFTDGLSSRLGLSADAPLLRERPLVIAHHLLATYAKNHDDALVLVAT